jgi:hypothetical protein
LIAGLDFQNAVTPWVLSALATALLVAFALTLRAWREARRSPYFFQRRRALQEMQSYSLVSLALMVGVFAVLAYAWSPVVDTTPRVRILTSAKPAPVVRDISLLASVTAPVAASGISLALVGQERGVTEPALPAEYNRLMPSADLLPGSSLSSLRFSTAIDQAYQPITPRNEFNPGSYTLYATFEYSEMQDGMVWAWVWRHNGAVVSGDERNWSYGDAGPGWVYFRPEKGFSEGEYTLELWVNGALMIREALTVISGSANQ